MAERQSMPEPPAAIREPAEPTRPRRPDDENPSAPASRGRRLLLVLLWSVVMVGLGATLAFEGFNRWVKPSAPTVELTIAPVTIDPTAPSEVEPMPDVVGLTVQQALEALADVGLDPGAVAVEERPWVGEVGRVVVQQPVRGTSDPDEVLLSVAEEASTPDIVGLSSADARAALEEIGVRAQVSEVAAPGVEPGTVVATQPGAGEPVVTDMVIDVAARPSAIYLDALVPLEGSCREDAAEVAGRSLDRSVVCQLRANRGEVSASYQLNGDVERFEAIVGQSDRTDLGAIVLVRVAVDGQDVAGVELGFGASEELIVPVDGALRLTITSLLVDDGEDDEASADQVDVVFGDARLIGPDPALDRLAGLR